MIKGAPYVIMDDIFKSIGFYILHRTIPPFIVKKNSHIRFFKPEETGCTLVLCNNIHLFTTFVFIFA